MEVRFKPKCLIVDNIDPEAFRILQGASWDSFFHKFLVFNLEVTKQFVETFDGETAQIGILTLHLSKHLISKVIGLPRTGERWFKNKHIGEKEWTPYINPSRKAHNSVNRIARNWLKSPWNELTFVIQKYITCQTQFSLIFLYHIRIFQHLSKEKSLSIPYYLLQSLNKMAMQVKRNNNKERSMFHHGFMKILVEHQLR